MLKIADIVASGGSITTAEMATGLPPGMLKQWLALGRHDGKDSPFNAFYRYYLAASSEARLAAESSLLVKNPSAWLERCDPLKQLEEHAQSSDTVNTTATKKESDDKITYREFDD
jgi:hypothetical protein